MTDDAAPASARRSWLQRTYDWILGHSRGKYAWHTLGAVSFLESSIFPIPPDILLVPMVLADRKRWLMLTLWCTVTSVAGGWLGYAIGALLYDSVGLWVVQFYGYSEKMDEFRKLYAEWGDWIIIVKGLTPIPYKVVTIASGFSGYDLWQFTWLSFITRFARFALVAGLLYWKGEVIRPYIEKHLGLTLLLLLGLIVGGLVAARFLF
jgi:membrane protein YqaA with SNARE-associated domain